MIVLGHSMEFLEPLGKVKNPGTPRMNNVKLSNKDKTPIAHSDSVGSVKLTTPYP